MGYQGAIKAVQKLARETMTHKLSVKRHNEPLDIWDNIFINTKIKK